MTRHRSFNKESKWNDLYKLIEETKIDIMCVSETHLMQLEVPPRSVGGRWIGNNRTAGQNRFGGVAIWIRAGHKICEVQNEPGNDICAIDVGDRQIKGGGRISRPQ